MGLRGVAPSRVRAAAPHSAPARMPGVYAQGLCTMQSQPSIHSLSRVKGVFGKYAEIKTHQALSMDAYKWSNKVGAGRTDNKRPRLHRCRANKAYTARHHGEGVGGFGKDAEIERPKALQDAKPTKRSYRDREFALFL